MTLDKEIKKNAQEIYEKSEKVVRQRYETGGSLDVDTDIVDSYVQMYGFYEKAMELDEQTKEFTEGQFREFVSEFYKIAEKEGYTPPKLTENAYENAERLISWVVEKKIIKY